MLADPRSEDRPILGWIGNASGSGKLPNFLYTLAKVPESCSAYFSSFLILRIIFWRWDAQIVSRFPLTHLTTSPWLSRMSLFVSIVRYHCEISLRVNWSSRFLSISWNRPFLEVLRPLERDRKACLSLYASALQMRANMNSVASKKFYLLTFWSLFESSSVTRVETSVLLIILLSSASKNRNRGW